MNQAEADAQARKGYDEMAEAYTNHVGLEMTVPSLGRSLLEAFAGRVQQQGPGAVADVGCGPGHVTAHLHEFGLDIFGVDNSPVLLDTAQADHPHIRFEFGQLASLPVETGSLQAIISKHSLIHTPADLVPAALDDFGRALTPGGLLYLSFFGSESPAAHGASFDHAVTTAYAFDIDAMAEWLSAAGFTEDVRVVQQPKEGERKLPHGVFFARREAAAPVPGSPSSPPRRRS